MLTSAPAKTIPHARALAALDAEIARATTWPPLKPIAVETGRPSAFPFDALGALLGNAAAAIARDVQAPDAIAAGAVLAASSLVAQPHANVLMPHGDRLPLSLYVVTSSASGDRKSGVDKVACHEIEEHRRQQMRDHARAQATSDPDDVPLARSLTASNATTEGLTKILKGQPSVGVFSPDGGEVLCGYSMREDRRAAALTFFLKGWSGETLDSLRGGDGLTTLLGRRIALHVMVQHVLLGQLLADPLAHGQGLLARCLIAEPESLAGSRPYIGANPAASAAVIEYNARIRNLLAIMPAVWAEGDGYELKPRNLILSDAARALWIQYYNAIEEQQAEGRELESARPFAAKCAEHAARIAGVIAMMENPTASAIDGATMDGAIQVASFYLGEHLRLTKTGRSARRSGLLLTLFEWMAKSQKQLDRRAILQSAPRGVRALKAAGIDDLLAELEVRGYIRAEGGFWEVRNVQD